jgi:fibro-slime domain-containing protein
MEYRVNRLVPAIALALSFACGATSGDEGSGTGTGATRGGGKGGGSGTGSNGGGAGFAPNFPDGGGINPGGASGTNSEGCGKLTAIVRDFTPDHEDFESYLGGLETGLVKDTLDADKLPEYAHNKPTQITTQQTFSQWYRDTAGVNMRIEVPLTLAEEKPGVFAFEDNSFFPADGKGFGNYRDTGHNFHFTTEIRGRFKYMGGEVFTFKGDDDVWVFVNGKLGLDLGGVHGVQMATLSFDQQKDKLGIQVGKTYTLDIFHAERHTSASNFRMETSIECLAVTIE